MISINRKVFRAQLTDLGYSGETRPPQFIAYFTDRDDALAAAEEAQGGRRESETGTRPEALEAEVDVTIYESLEEYQLDQSTETAEAVIATLTEKQLAALGQYFRGTKA